MISQSAFTLAKLEEIPWLLRDFVPLSRLTSAVIASVGLAAIYRENINALYDRPKYTGLGVRLVIIFVAVWKFDLFFTWFMKIPQIAGLVILSDDRWAEMFTMFQNYALASTPGILSISLPKLILWASSFGAIIAECMLGWISFALLCLLYLVGPLAMCASIYPSSSDMAGTWTKNTMSVAMWVPMFRAAVFAFLTILKAFYGIEPGEMAAKMDYVGLITIGISMVVITWNIPKLADSLIGGRGMSSIGTGAVFALMAAMSVKKGIPAKVMESKYGTQREGKFTKQRVPYFARRAKSELNSFNSGKADYLKKLPSRFANRAENKKKEPY